MKSKKLIDTAFENCMSGELLKKDVIVALLGLDPGSKDAEYLRKRADEAAHIITGNSAYLWGALGVDCIPCSMNCKFCSFGEAWGLVEKKTYYSDEEILAQVKYYADNGFRFIVLRTTEFYSTDDLCKKIKKIHEEIPGNYEMILNTGEFSLDIAEKMYDAGTAGIYHALRLREGTDTGFDPQERLATLQAVKDSPLKLISLVEPVGPEHTDEEIAEAFLVTARYNAYVSGTMARVPVKGTPLGEGKIISDKRIAQLVAVFRLASGRKIKNICVHPASREAVSSGANIVVVEVGAIPRDDKIAKSEWNAFTAGDAKKILTEAGYRVCAEESKIKPDPEYLKKTNSLF